MRVSRRTAIRLALGGASTLGLGAAAAWDEAVEKRVAVVAPGRLLRGAWQCPWPLRRIIARGRIRTIVTLTAINRDDPKYVRQACVVGDAGVDWIIVPMRGSRATLPQMREAADLLADPSRQPVFFHCVAGHHRTTLVHAAYLIRHREFSADRAWREVASLPWTRPEAVADRADRRLIAAFADAERPRLPLPGAGAGADDEDEDHNLDHATRPVSSSSVGGPAIAGLDAGRPRVHRLELRDGQLRDRPPRPGLPFRTAAGGRPWPDRS